MIIGQLHIPGDAEVRNVRVQVGVEQDVAGFDVPVHDTRLAVMVQVRQPLGCSQGDVEPGAPVQLDLLHGPVQDVVKASVLHVIVQKEVPQRRQRVSSQSDEVPVLHPLQHLQLVLKLRQVLRVVVVKLLDGDGVPALQHALVHLAGRPLPHHRVLVQIIGDAQQLIVRLDDQAHVVHDHAGRPFGSYVPRLHGPLRLRCSKHGEYEQRNEADGDGGDGPNAGRSQRARCFDLIPAANPFNFRPAKVGVTEKRRRGEFREILPHRNAAMQRVVGHVENLQAEALGQIGGENSGQIVVVQ
ncbi:hypothetical protein Mapa_000257 [Marchantia paleacea]|nr:hypothetical protein Mapa_000257 [Marchantia paleacea]